MKILPRILIAIAFVVALLPLAACQTAPPVRTVTLEEFFSPPSGKVLSTADSIVVKGVRTRFVEGNLRTDFKILNNRGRRNVVNYRVQWLDKDDMMASPYDSWITMALEGQQEMVVTALSPNSNAVDYRLEIQPN